MALEEVENAIATLDGLDAMLRDCLQRDRFKYRSQLRRLKSTKPVAAAKVQELAERIKKSVATRDHRSKTIPTPQLDTDLPIYDRRDEIAETIRDNQVVIISGETGSGKSTQLPLIALQNGIGARGYIGHTQPRRLAARSVANRIASQMNTPLGQAVGFKIRFDDKTSDKTFVKLMTDGILLAETQSDRFLDQYEMLIIDEAHERSLNIDFLIGHLKRILAKRSDLKVVITSATIDTARFAEHFCDNDGNPAPIINVEGRTYPVEIQYRPPESDSELSGDSFNDHIANSIRQVVSEEQGDLLVFLPTERDIKNVHKKLRGLNNANPIEILPLYARLSNDQQNAIFNPGKRRRIVLATNVAESSITVPRIRMVVDSGTARISRYAARSKVQRLPIEAISQASANQRAGRCGRIGPGICVRLYGEEDFESRPDFTTPEIRRTNLASVILQTLALKLGDINEFPFMEPPHKEAVSDGYKTLFEIGAIDDRRQLTELGRKLSRIPVDPRIGRMLFAGHESGCLNEVLIIASALEVQDPRVRPAEKQNQADEQHAKFTHEKSDFMSYLKLWDFFHKLRSDLSRSKYRLACQQNFLSMSAIHQWQEVHRQLKRLAIQNKLQVAKRKDEYNVIHRSLLTGLLSGIAMVGDHHEYTGAGGVKFHLWPGSGIFETKPKWIVAAEIVETARRYGRTVAKIAPEWIEPLAEHLVRSNFVDPNWSKKQQTVMAYENVSLFGLPIVSRRRVGYAKIDPEVTRELFIEHGIIEGQMQHTFGFAQHNQKLLDDMEQAAAKTRRRDWVVQPALLYQFFNDKLPEHCVDVAALRRAIKKRPELDKELRLTSDDLSVEFDSHDMAQRFPDSVQIGSMELPMEYRFEPGGDDDGATMIVPRDALGQINELQAGWLVPGLNEPRVAALIKSLPKSIRRNFVPIPESAQTVCEQLVHGEGNFITCVARELSRFCGEPISVDAFDLARMEDCLKINLAVVDEQGEVLARGRDVNELRKELGCEAESFVQATEDVGWDQDGLTAWTWGDLPEKIMLQRGVASVPVYPAIVDQQTAVGLRLADSRSKADELSRTGVMRLYAIVNKKSLKRQINWLPDFDRQALQLSGLISSSDLREGLRDTITNIAFLENKKLPVNEKQFTDRNDNSVELISVATQSVAKWLPKFASSAHEALLALEKLPARYQPATEDITHQIQALAGSGFLTATPWTWLQHFPRYFAAIKARCEKVPGNEVKDREAFEDVKQYWSTYLQLECDQKAIAMVSPELVTLRWMIEEYRVSHFAQKLGTSVSVSPKRLSKQLALVTSK